MRINLVPIGRRRQLIRRLIFYLDRVLVIWHSFVLARKGEWRGGTVLPLRLAEKVNPSVFLFILTGLGLCGIIIVVGLPTE